MRNIIVVTTFNENGFNTYGKKMVKSFDTFWPDNIHLYVYYEGNIPSMDTSNRIHWKNLHDESKDLVNFKERHKNDPVAHGKASKSPKGLTRIPSSNLKHKAKHEGIDSFLYDAVRFSHKVFTVISASENIKSDILIWLDGDVKTFRKIPENFFENLIPNDTHLTYLGREEKYSECGFVAYNKNHKVHDIFIKIWKELYENDTVFNLEEWHDSYVFDYVRNLFDVKNNNLNYYVKDNGHPFINSELGNYLDHLKGKRKEIGHSSKKDIKTNKEIDYWKNI